MRITSLEGNLCAERFTGIRDLKNGEFQFFTYHSSDQLMNPLPVPIDIDENCRKLESQIQLPSNDCLFYKPDEDNPYTYYEGWHVRDNINNTIITNRCSVQICNNNCMMLSMQQGRCYEINLTLKTLGNRPLIFEHLKYPNVVKINTVEDIVFWEGIKTGNIYWRGNTKNWIRPQMNQMRSWHCQGKYLAIVGINSLQVWNWQEKRCLWTIPKIINSCRDVMIHENCLCVSVLGSGEVVTVDLE